MRVLVAPQEFKGSLGPDEAAATIAAGIRKVHPDWQFDILPLSDGGPGFLDALRHAAKSDTFAEIVHDPLGRKVLGRFGMLRASRTTVIEAAAANGLHHVTPEERDPLRADTFGVGQMILSALTLKPRAMVIGVGGSATTDGGAGMARALGARFTDMAGNELPPGGAALADLERIDWQRPTEFDGVDIAVGTDVTNPLVGPLGAATVFGPQKGATPDQVDILEAALLRYAAVLKRSLGVDIANLPGAGAAGGLAGGLHAFLGARILSGFDLVAGATNLHKRFAAADIIVTGEGSFDSQSLAGKGPGRLLELARAAGKPVVVFAGRSGVEDPAVRSMESIEADATRSMANAPDVLRALAQRWAADFDGR